MISSVEVMGCMTAHLFYCQPGKNESWQKTYKFTLIAEKLFWTLPLTWSKYHFSWKILYRIKRYEKRVPERLPSRLHKIYCKEYVLTKFLLPTSQSYEIRLQPPNEHPVVFSLRLEIHQRTQLRPKQIHYISGNRGRFSNMSGLSSSTAFNPRESTSSIWSLMILLRGQITETQPFVEINNSKYLKHQAFYKACRQRGHHIFLTQKTLNCRVLLFLQIDRSTGP